jgi:cytochrome c-type biogenesis protein
MGSSSVTIGFAFLAGLASFLSPCVLSLVPVYIGILGGRSFGNNDAENVEKRWITAAHGLAFVIGFSLVFITFGVITSSIGNILYQYRLWIARLGGLIVAAFGIHIIGIVRIPFLEYDLRPRTQFDQQRGLLSSLLMGIFFSMGWSPCIGPVLGAIYALTLQEGSVVRGIQMLTAYSAGMGLPFLAVAVGMSRATVLIRRFSSVTRYVEIAMGVLLVIVGGMLFMGTFEVLGRLFPVSPLGL